MAPTGANSISSSSTLTTSGHKSVGHVERPAPGSTPIFMLLVPCFCQARHAGGLTDHTDCVQRQAVIPAKVAEITVMGGSS
eukprot:157381-Amphidinium_carterae.1